MPPTGPSSRPSSATGASPTAPSPRRSGSPRRPCAAGSSACARPGIIQIVAVTDPLQLGFTRQAMIGISVEGDVRRVADKVAALAEVDYVVMCAGSFDLLAEIVCEDDERAARTCSTTPSAPSPACAATETFLYLKLAKQTYTWGTR